MVQVPYTPYPTSRPSNEPLAYLTAEGASPEAFGAGIGRALQGLGVAVGSLLEAYQQREEQSAKFEANKRFLELNNQLMQDYLEFQRNAPPDGRGFVGQFMGHFGGRADAFLAGLPPQLQEEYAPKLEALRGRYIEESSVFAFKTQDTYQLNSINSQVSIAQTRLQQVGPEELDLWRSTIEEYIDNSTLSEVDKENAKRAASIALEAAAYRGDVATRGEEAIGGLGVTRGEGNIQERIIERESSGRANVINQFGFAGLYQFGAPRVEHLGVYTPGPSENMSRWSKTGRAVGNKWTGTFNIPGHPEVKTIQDFLANPEAQHAVWEIHKRKMDEEIASNGFDSFIGKTVGGVEITKEGLYAMLHLGGVGGTRNALHGGDSQDANGTRVLEYAKLGIGATSDGPSKMDSRFGNIPYDMRLDLTREAQRLLDERRAEAAQAARTAYDAQLNTALVGALDGTFGYPELAQARETWLTDYDDITKVMNAIEKRQGDVADVVATAEALADPNKVWIRASEDKKLLNTYFESSDGRNKLYEMDDAFVNSSLLPVYQRTKMLPQNAVMTLESMINSPDIRRFNYAMGVLDRLERMNPTAFQMDVEEATEKKLAEWRVLRAYYNEEELAERIKKSQEPSAIRAYDTLVEEGRAKAREVPTDDIVSQFDPGYFSFEPDAPQSAPELAQLRVEHDEIYAEMYARLGPNGDVEGATLALLKRRWGATEVGGTTERLGTNILERQDYRVMRLPPELSPAYPTIDGSHAWMHEQAWEQLRPVLGDKRFTIVADTITEQEWNGKEIVVDRQPRVRGPSYLVVFQDAYGGWQTLRNRAGKDVRIWFDPTDAIVEHQRRFLTEQQDLREAGEELRRMQEGTYGAP